MVMKKVLAVLAAICLLASVSVADDQSINIGSLELGDTYLDITHVDADPFKGALTVTVTNTGTEAWTDFHFEIWNGFGGDATSVLFVDGGSLDPTSTQVLDSWSIGTTTLADPGVAGGIGFSKIDLYFANDVVNVGETATFTVYTDNTAEELTWFGVAVYPTPEPATMAMLALGGLLIRRRK